MTTEDDFQQALDARPDNWQTRLVFADWLQERGDPRAEGYRALGRLGRWPFEYGLRDKCSPTELWGYHDGTGLHQPPRGKSKRVRAKHALPPDWIAEMNAGAKDTWCPGIHSRRETEDAAARAFAQLPAERRAEFLANPTTSNEAASGGQLPATAQAARGTKCRNGKMRRAR